MLMIFLFSGKMASKRVATTALDFGAMAAKIAPEQKGAFGALKVSHNIPLCPLFQAIPTLMDESFSCSWNFF